MVEWFESSVILVILREKNLKCIFLVFLHFFMKNIFILWQGVFTGKDCPSDSMKINHAVVVVGYDSVNHEEYWIVKNSWGTKWGKDGYIYIKRNTGKKYGVCAINAWGRLLVKRK